MIGLVGVLVFVLVSGLVSGLGGVVLFLAGFLAMAVFLN